MKRTLPLLILVFALLVNINTNANSQTPPCFPGYQGLTYQMDEIQNCPPYNSNMPLDVFIGYLALDSLSKYADFENYNKFVNRQSYNDTLRTMMRYNYKTIDYNPNLYLNFMYHNKYSRRSIYYYHYGLIEKILKESPQPILDASLIGSYLIAKIYVDSIYQYIDTISGPINSRMVYATINQIYKGTSPINTNNQLVIEPTIQFEYARDWFVNGYIDSTEITFELEKDQSYIVFLEYRFICRNNLDLYFTIFPFRSSYSETACMYPIVNGNVIDINNELGFGTNVNINVFNTMLNNRINLITNYTP